MTKLNIGKDACVCPMPIVVVGTMIDGKPNFMTAAWVTRVNYEPAIMGVAIGKTHLTAKGIRENGEFSLSIPSVELVREVDYVGIVSGNRKDKSSVFPSFAGELKNAPMVAACPLAMECRLRNSVDLGADEFFIGDIVGVYTEEQYMTDGKPDPKKMKPFCFTMPDNLYWTLGEPIGKAWSIGKDYKG